MKLFRSILLAAVAICVIASCSKSNNTPQVDPLIVANVEDVHFSSVSDTVVITLASEYYIDLFMPEKLWLEVSEKTIVDPETDPEAEGTVKEVTIVAAKNHSFYSRDNMIQFRNDGYELNIPILQDGKPFCDFYSVDDPGLTQKIVPFKDTLECTFTGDTTFVAKPNEDNVFITLDTQDWVECDHAVLSAYSDPVNLKFTVLSENTSYEPRSCKVTFANQTETYSVSFTIIQKGAPKPEPGPEE